MNYLPFAGYWFYGAQNDTERASFFCSLGLLEMAPEVILVYFDDTISAFYETRKYIYGC